MLPQSATCHLGFNELSSDAATSWGMAGVLVFNNESPRKDRIQGLFWQIPWVEWYKFIPMPSLTVGSVKINVAEFLALLITCETFTSFCKGKYTTIVTDNISDKSWVNKARCPHFPFDRCAQGLHLYMKYNGMNRFTPTKNIPQINNYLIYFFDVFWLFLQL